MNKKVKKCIDDSIFWASLVTISSAFSMKVGHRKWHPELTPISWNQMIEAIPLFIGIGILTFLIVFTWKYFSYNEIQYCMHCKSVVPKTKSNLCPTCKHPTEKLEGFFDRHPKLKKK
jgi:hypothetical protein